MSTLSVPLTPRIEEMIEQMVKEGVAENKAALVRRAIEKFAEEKAIMDVLISEREASQGKIFRGDLRKIVGKIK